MLSFEFTKRMFLIERVGVRDVQARGKQCPSPRFFPARHRSRVRHRRKGAEAEEALRGSD